MRIASIAAGAVIAFAASLGATAAFAQSLQYLGPSDASGNGRTGVTGFNELCNVLSSEGSSAHRMI